MIYRIWSLGSDLSPSLGRAGLWGRGTEGWKVGVWVRGRGGGGFLVAYVSLLTGVLGVEKMLVLGTSRVVRWALTFTVDTFWGCISEFKTIFGSVGLVTFNTLCRFATVFG